MVSSFAGGLGVVFYRGNISPLVFHVSIVVVVVARRCTYQATNEIVAVEIVFIFWKQDWKSSSSLLNRFVLQEAY